MRNITHTAKTPLDGLTEIGKGMHSMTTIKDGTKVSNPIYTSYHSELDTLKDLYQSYNEHTVPCTLESLTTAYPVGNEHHDALYNLYDPERKVLQNLRKELRETGSRTTYCPYCHSNVASELDHYIPRSVMPEYSVHYYNLIPLCHNCNNDKHEKWLEKGQRLFFNAYFDAQPDMSDVLDCSISINKDTGSPQASLTLKAPTATDTESVRLAKSTIEKLNLITQYWQMKADQVMEKIVSQLIYQYVVLSQKPTLFEHYTNQMNVLLLDIRNAPSVEVIQNLVRTKATNSPILKQWALTPGNYTKI